jgi:nucleoside-diphosphate kinase
MTVESTLLVVKPDGVRRGLVGEVLRRAEDKGLRVAEIRSLTIDRALAEEHYGEHRDKPFFGELVGFITTGSTLALVLEGEDAVSVTRMTIGATNPVDAAPGTIRGDLALAMPNNLVHGSDSPETAEREIALWFGDARL